MAKYKNERRMKRQRQQRRNMFIAVLAVALFMVLIITLPGIIEAAQPVGDIVMITPVARPSAEGRTMGNPDAPVVIDVFEDFQCSACATYTFEIEKQIIDELIPTGNVYYVFHQYPFLDDRISVKESDQAANASMCALEQGRFWDYHDMLYANQSGENASAYSDKRLIAFAEALGLDSKAFETCLEESRYQAEIDQDLAKGAELGVTGTPSVFVNGVQIMPGYVPSFESIKEAVDTALAD
jgi:protein-disulfide isomerase